MSLSKELARAVEVCAYCPSLCRFACPVEASEGREAASPRFMVGLLHHLGTGVFPWGPEAGEAFGYCDGCGACQSVCDHGNPVPRILQRARAMARDRGFGSGRANRVLEHLAAGFGPGGGVLAGPLREARPELQGRAAPLLVWPSDRCLEAGPETLTATVAFLEGLGFQVALPRPEEYAPSAAWARVLGAEPLAAELGKRLASVAARHGEIFCEEPAEVAAGFAGAGSRVRTWWDVIPEAGLRPGEPATTRFLCEALPDPGMRRIGLAAGLEEVTEGGAPHLSSGGQGLLDLLVPEAAQGLRARLARRLAGEGVLVASPWSARWLREGGVLAVDPGRLVTRKS